ncbi:MAG TPA: nuclear transport factor 2 family protein [Streptosporangiaceae bacterium]|nr:nuclear transport factor 2 family protein [Streptosporangiaceae bacterium]
MTDRAMVSDWLARYEAAWRAPGTGRLAGIFTEDVTYRQSPYEEPVAGLEAVGRMWDEERDGPDEVFTLSTEILAVDGPTAVVRAEVHYGDPAGQEYRDLWVMRLGDDGRCHWFEEWAYWPGLPYAPGDR